MSEKVSQCAASTESSSPLNTSTTNSPALSRFRIPMRTPLRTLGGSRDKVRAAFKSPARVATGSTAETSGSTSLREEPPCKKPRVSHGDEASSVHTPTTPHTPKSRSKATPVPSESPDSVARDIMKLKEELQNVEDEVAVLSREYSEDELPLYIKRLHEYNEMKDVGQLLLGKLAEVQGTTTASLYERFGLDLDD